MNEAEEKNREIANAANSLLKDFKADQTWQMNTGDMLYLPPRIPHRGKYI